MPLEPSETSSKTKLPTQAETETETPALMLELTADQFGLWRRHPVTELVLDRYFNDFLATLEHGVISSWLAGNLSLQVEQDARGYIHALRHIQALRLGELRQFWSVQPSETVLRASERHSSDTRHSSGTGY